MTVEIIAICDAATDSQGKLNLLGAFDNVWSPQVPVVVPQCAIALRIRFVRIEEGDHRIKINIVDADGKPALPSLDAQVKVQIVPPHDSMAINLILNVQRLKLERYGSYAIDFAINGRQEASIPLNLWELKQPPPPSPEAAPPA